MPFFLPSDFQVFTDPRAADPSSDVERVRLRDKLAWLHEQIYPEIRARRWDIHPHWTKQYLISTARLVPGVPRIDFLLLRYGKAETVVKLMKKEFGEDLSHPYSTALLGVRANAHGLAVELLLPDKAWADGRNFKNKLAHGAPQKRHLRQLFAELGRYYYMTLELPSWQTGSAVNTELLRIKCSRLVNLGTLDAAMGRFAAGEHQLRVSADYAADDERLDGDALPGEILYRLGQLYLLYQFVSWSPRNDYLPRANAQDADSELRT